MNPDAETIKSFLVVLLFLTTVASSIKAFWFPPKPADPIKQPFEVKGSIEYVQRREFDELKMTTKEDITRVEKSMDKQFTDLKEERKESIKNLHHHITSSCESIKEQITELDERYHERLSDGNHTMITHGEDIAALKAMNKGGKC